MGGRHYKAGTYDAPVGVRTTLQQGPYYIHVTKAASNHEWRQPNLQRDVRGVGKRGDGETKATDEVGVSDVGWGGGWEVAVAQGHTNTPLRVVLATHATHRA